MKEAEKERRRKKKEDLEKEKQKEKQKKKDEQNEQNNETAFLGQYNIQYSQVELNGPSYSFRPKLNSDLFIKKNEDEMVGYNENELKSTGFSIPNPDFNINKESFPRFIMPKSDRFNFTYASNINSIHSYTNYEKDFREQSKASLYKETTGRDTFFGTANRFRTGYSNNVPGPNNYKIEGFAESRVRFYKMRDEMRKGKIVSNQINEKSKAKDGIGNIGDSHNMSLYDECDMKIKNDDFNINQKINENEIQRITTIHAKHHYESEDEDVEGNRSVSMFELDK